MAEILEGAELAQHDGVAEMDVGCRRVDAELHAQLSPGRRSRCELRRKLALRQTLDGVCEQRASLLRSALRSFVEGVFWGARHREANARLSLARRVLGAAPARGSHPPDVRDSAPAASAPNRR